jgi:hypothetical protein
MHPFTVCHWYDDDGTVAGEVDVTASRRARAFIHYSGGALCSDETVSFAKRR